MIRTGKNSGIMAMVAMMLLTICSCVTSRSHPRHHRHRPHRHKVVIVAEQTTVTGQDIKYTTFEKCLAMTEPYIYGNTE